MNSPGTLRRAGQTFMALASKAGLAALAILLLALPSITFATERGPVTNLPIPRFVSMKASEANIRRGPSLSHRIDWIFHRRNTPLEVTAEYGHWRKVRDADGAGGWIHYTLLSGVRHVLIRADHVVLRDRPDPNARPVAQAENGAIAKLEECEVDWCEVSADRRKGWVPVAEIWGVDAEDVSE
jgi:SH3-like domain-containing protein